MPNSEYFFTDIYKHCSNAIQAFFFDAQQKKNGKN